MAIELQPAFFEATLVSFDIFRWQNVALLDEIDVLEFCNILFDILVVHAPAMGHHFLQVNLPEVGAAVEATSEPVLSVLSDVTLCHQLRQALEPFWTVAAVRIVPSDIFLVS